MRIGPFPHRTPPADRTARSARRQGGGRPVRMDENTAMRHPPPGGNDGETVEKTSRRHERPPDQAVRRADRYGIRVTMEEKTWLRLDRPKALQDAIDRSSRIVAPDIATSLPHCQQRYPQNKNPKHTFKKRKIPPRKEGGGRTNNFRRPGLFDDDARNTGHLLKYG